MRVTASLLAIVALMFTSASYAETALEQLVGDVQRELARSQAQAQARMERFERDVAKQQSSLEELRARVDAAQARNETLSARAQTQQGVLQQLQAKLAQENIQAQQLQYTARELAQQVLKGLQQDGQQVLSTRYAPALAFAHRERLPTPQELRSFWLVLLELSSANSALAQQPALVVLPDGQTEQREVMRVGPFAAIDSQGRYLSYDTALAKYRVIPGLEALQEQASAFFGGNSAALVVDVTGGELLYHRSQQPSLLQRLHQGSTVGYIIVGLGGLGLIVGLWRVLSLLWLRRSLVRQRNSAMLSERNPLGRLLLRLQQASSTEQLERFTDEVLLQELPRIERGQSLVKLFAAVAPLLGLLGTVTGMIVTFQSITQLGVSDPKLMAGGISQALVTTVLGLCVAVPLLFIHSYLAATARAIAMQLQHSALAYQAQLESRDRQEHPEWMPSTREMSSGLGAVDAIPI